jgi:HAD superfamily hydrolase (TIGR01509 family)
MNTGSPINDKYKAISELTRGNYAAFLYDCDGTLADNMEAHKKTYVKVAAGNGVTIDPGIVDELAGYPIPDVVVEINKRYHTDFDPKEFEQMKSDLFYEEFIPQTKPIDHVVEHLKASAGKYKIAVVSGGSVRMIKKTLEVLGIYSLVDVMVCSEDYQKGKPDPEPFLVAATKLGVEPGACIVFEDGEAGVRAAEAAGMKWIRIDQL